MSEERPPVGNSPPEDDLRAVIAASLAEDKDKQAAAPDPSSSGTPSGGEGGAPQLLEGGPAPGEGDGGAPGKVEEPPKPGEGEPPKPGEGEPPRPAATPAEDTTEAPTHWSADDKAQFSALPKGARGPFLNLYKRMEAGFTPKLQRGAQLERDYGELDTLIFNPPTRQYLTQLGSSPVRKINEWAEIERGLLPTPDNATQEQRQHRQEVRNQIAARIIHNYGADPGRVAAILNELRGFAPASGGDGGRPAVPASAAAPAVDPILHQRLQVLENESQQQKQQREAIEYARAGDQIAAFANEKDAAGNLKHPFFAEAEIQAKMTSLAEFERTHGRAPVLEEIYNTAIHGNPTFHQRTLALEKDAETKRVQEERRAKAEQAKRAGSSVTGAPGPGQTASNPAEMSLRDQIKANMNGGGQTSGGPGRI